MEAVTLGARPVVLGASGQVGTAVTSALSGALALGRSQLDLLDPGAVQATLDAIGPTAVINCAAWTGVDAAEDNEEAATVVNARATQEMAAFCASRLIPLLTFSTDYVFDGKASEPYTESAPRSPLNAYGRSKALGEDLVFAAYPNALVVRSSWVISDTNRSFLSAILAKLADGPVRVVSDQWGAPTAAGDLAKASLAALEKGVTGILHITNAGETTWHGLAAEAAGVAGYDTALVEACATEDYPTRAVRPRYSVLGSERLDQVGLSPLPPWQDALARLVPNVMKWMSP